LRRLARDRGGVVMVEFAFVLPLLVLMLLGSFVISDMITCYRKVTVTTRALADMISRSVIPDTSLPPTLQAPSSIATYLNSAGLVMTPYATSNLTVQISELRVCDASHAYVLWSQAQTGSSAITPNQTAGSVVTIPTGLIPSGSPMIPTSADGSDVCNNTTAGTNKTQVGWAGGYLYFAQVNYTYTPAVSYQKSGSTPMADSIYMIPRLN